MNFRVVVLLTVLCPLAVYAGFVVGSWELPPCDGAGHSESIPNNEARCPSPETFDCRDGGTDFAVTHTLWLIQTSLSGDYEVSAPDQLHPIPGLQIPYPEEYDPVFYWKSFEARIIEETDNRCGGRQYVRKQDPFESKPTDNEYDFVMPGPDHDCYQYRRCRWNFGGEAHNVWYWDENMEDYVRKPSFPIFVCRTGSLSPMWPGITVIKCYETEAW